MHGDFGCWKEETVLEIGNGGAARIGTHLMSIWSAWDGVALAPRGASCKMEIGKRYGSGTSWSSVSVTASI